MLLLYILMFMFIGGAVWFLMGKFALIVAQNTTIITIETAGIFRFLEKTAYNGKYRTQEL
ncbi:hypothetical protein KKF04_04700 [Patescibacteria group bacterium]|nr:hypothetical protein [Patescibacteria group bacterium]